jgi:hypothetical protein
MSDLDPIRDLVATLKKFRADIDKGMANNGPGRQGLELTMARVERMLRAAPVLTDRPVIWIDGEPEGLR